jgi:ribose 5-phosphate isomerase A
MPQVTNQDKAKEAAARYAVEHVKPGMVLGLGSGSTSKKFVEQLGAKCRLGLEIKAVCTSSATELAAKQHKIPLIPIEQVLQIDLAVDGADEVDKNHHLVKGGGGALLREKIVAFHAKTFLVLIDESKLVTRLGKFPVPVEVAPFGASATLEALSSLGMNPSLRKKPDGAVFITDNGNYTIDLHLNALIEHPIELDRQLKNIPGILETGLFLNYQPVIIVGNSVGNAKQLEKK